MIPAAMAGYRQFICWTLIDKGGKKPDKVPINPVSGIPVNPMDPNNWMDATTAIQYGYGVGFVFTKEDPFFFIDIDACLDNSTWSNLAIHMCNTFAGCYVEVSYSGDGLHIFGTGTHPAHRCKNKALNMEIYTQERFCALTGTGATGDASMVAQKQLNDVVKTYFPTIDIVGTDSEWTIQPCDNWYGITDDDELIGKMVKSKSGAAMFGTKATIKELWTADTIALEKYFPDPQRDFDHSGADAALLSHLAFWTGKDCSRMDKLFRKSALMRDKWNRKEGTYGSYGNRSIIKACGQCSNVYGTNKKPASQPTLGEAIVSPIREGFQFLPIDKQQLLFKDCCYVRDLHKAFTPDGGMLKPDQFRAMFGGYVFALDNINDKTTRNAWEAFTESQAFFFPKAHGVCFRPELPSGNIIEEENRTLLNTYVPIKVNTEEGDVAPFLKHCETVLPDLRDREILISYMAACVQHKGVKFQWSPLLQGCEGNGKSLFTRILSYAVGHRYTHVANASDLDSKFNGWLMNKLLVIIEEIFTSDKRDTAEIMKPYITNDRVEIQNKGVDQYTGDNRANFFMCSNHKDSVIKNRNDRRYCIMYMAQQDFTDMVHCGWLTSSGNPTNYFKDIYNWLRAGGYARVAHYLNTYEITDALNPAADCHRAPITSSTKEVIAMSIGGIEQEIFEAIEEKRYGFANGWISSMAFDRMLEVRRDNKRITRNKRKELLRNMGYVPHPHLKNGRVNTIIPADAGKPRLYIIANSILSNIIKPSDIAARYMKDQQPETEDMKGEKHYGNM